LCVVQSVGPADVSLELIREIELLRAWDVFRTITGIRATYGLHSDRLKRTIQLAWEYRPVASVEANGSTSSDVEYASRLAAYAADRLPEIRQSWPAQLNRLLTMYRQLDAGTWRNPITGATNVWQTWNAIRRVRRKLAPSMGDSMPLAYFRDERFERDLTWVD
jgi:hypothetical protein